LRKKVIDLDEERRVRSKKKVKEKKKAHSRVHISRKAKLAVVGVFALFAVLFGSQVYDLLQLDTQRSQLESQKDEKAKVLENLEKDLAEVNDPSRVERLARERFHMLKDGEVLYVFPEEEIDTTQ
jgi:cell division protein DivIC